MYLSIDILVWKITLKCFAVSLGDIVLEPRLIILTGRFTLLNSRYSVLLELTDNLFEVIHVNTSLIQDLIVEKADEARSGENDK